MWTRVFAVLLASIAKGVNELVEVVKSSKRQDTNNDRSMNMNID